MPIRSELRWLLDRAAEWCVPVGLVLPEWTDQIAQWNAPCPRWSSQQVLSSLGELGQRGWIRFFVSGPDPEDVEVHPPDLNPRALVKSCRHDRQPLAYRLTPEGAAIWESAAQPRWRSKYCFEVRPTEAGGEEETECVVTAHDEELARRALLITACHHDLLVVPGTECYSHCENWPATYWKSFERGVQARALVREDVCSQVEQYNLEFLLPPGSQRYLVESLRLLDRWFDPVQEPDWQFREYLEYGSMGNHAS